MKKLLGIMVLSLLLSGNAYAKIFVLNKCWEPIEKNAYGDKVKNFKEYKKVQKEKFKNTKYVFEDHIIKIDSEKMTIVKRYDTDDKEVFMAILIQLNLKLLILKTI